MRLFTLIFGLLLFGACSILSPNIGGKTSPVSEPITPRKSREIIASGDTRADAYAWLSDKKNPAVRSHLEQEKKYTDYILSFTQKFQDKIFEEISGRVDLPRTSLREANGTYDYFSRYRKGDEFPTYVRENQSAEEQVILDVAKMAEGQNYFRVSNAIPSPDNKYLAYAVDRTGRRIYEIHFKNIQTGKILPIKVKGVTSNFEWANDSKHFFYTKHDKTTLRWNQIWRLSLADYKAKLLFHEDDEEFSVSLHKSNSNKYIFISSESSNTTEQRYIDANQPLSSAVIIQKRIKDMSYFTHDGGDRFYIRTNYYAPNYKIVKVTKNGGKLGAQYWKGLLASNLSEYIERIQVYEDFLVVQIKQNGNNRLKIMSRVGALRSHEINFDSKSYYARLISSLPYTSASFRYSYETLNIPTEDFSYQVYKREPTVVREKEIPFYKSSNYTTETTMVKGIDGVEIPVTITFDKSTQKTEKTPLVLYGYGAYGMTYEAFFNESIISLLDRGFIFAIAHVRGGSKKGRQWYLDGKMKNKKNSFNDFIAVAQDLITKKYTSPQHMYAMGGSAGGLLVAAVMNEAPELFNAVIAEVPFVDVLNTMLDSSIPLTIPEYQEWGNPNKSDYYQYIKSYSPYENIKEINYPHVYATSYWQDSQVQYWEPAKWISRLRDYNQNKKSIMLLDMNFEGGHGGGSGRVKRLRQKAKIYSFILGVEQGSAQ